MRAVLAEAVSSYVVRFMSNDALFRFIAKVGYPTTSSRLYVGFVPIQLVFKHFTRFLRTKRLSVALIKCGAYKSIV